ncbi:MAG: copper chaperone PCu(A)C [Pseudomonadaceae bacterium]|nr:MAG: copper chaperone PCu(A)C [Pseudomonadaceae bacterium]
MRQLLAAALATTALLSQPLLAHEYEHGDLHIDHPWSRAMPSVATTGAAYLIIRNSGDSADTLLSASTPAAGHTELHEHVHEDGLMKMRELPEVEIAAGEQVEFKPGGYHVMLFNLQQPLDAGTEFPLTLTFANAGEIEVNVHVEDNGGEHHGHGDHDDHHDSHDHHH